MLIILEIIHRAIIVAEVYNKPIISQWYLLPYNMKRVYFLTKEINPGSILTIRT